MNTVSGQAVKQFTECCQMGSPFDIDNEKACHAWREIKFENYPENVEVLIVEVNDPAALCNAEYRAIHALVLKTNMGVYAGNTGVDPEKVIPAKLGEQYGLSGLDDNMDADDGVTSLKVVTWRWRSGYIPYNNKAIHWHIDGYYNPLDLQICALLLHCVSPAAKGGENALLDHEIAHIHLRDTNPDHIKALWQMM